MASRWYITKTAYIKTGSCTWELFGNGDKGLSGNEISERIIPWQSPVCMYEF